MTTATLSLKGAKLVDFTGKVEGFEHIPVFNEKFVDLIRSQAQTKVVVVIDTGFAFKKEAAHTVSDHINFTGSNPLIGPNNPCGERFPVVQNIYIPQLLPELPSGIVAGLKQGVIADEEEIELMRSFNVDFYSYNMAPSMLVAAHAGWKVLGIVVPEGQHLDKGITQKIINTVQGK